MTGAYCGAAVMGAAALPALSAQVQLSTSDSAFNVSGAAGDLYAQGGVVISVNASGGTGSYAETLSAVSDGGSGTGHVSITPAADGIHNTVGWAGLAVGDQRLFHLKYTVNDGVSSKTDIAPDAGVFLIKRVS